MPGMSLAAHRHHATASRIHRVAGALAAAVMGLTWISVCSPPAHAAAARAARPAGPQLHVAHRTLVAKGKNADDLLFAEGSNGAVFFARGKTATAVLANGHERVAARSGDTIHAMAATATDLFVQAGLTVTEYSIPGARAVRHWTLTSAVTPITQAGLFVEGKTLWAWTDWENDSSGLEYAQVSRMSTTSSTVHVVTKRAYPFDLAADQAGLFFESIAANDSTQYLDRAAPSGGVKSRAFTAPQAQLALDGNRVVLLDFGSSTDVDTYSTTTLARESSKKVPTTFEEIADTTSGLLVLARTCNSCAGSVLSVLNPATAGTSGTVSLPGFAYLFPGPQPAVIETGAKSSLYLVRIS